MRAHLADVLIVTGALFWVTFVFTLLVALSVAVHDWWRHWWRGLRRRFGDPLAHIDPWSDR